MAGGDFMVNKGFVVVTGVSSGIGWAISDILIKNGYGVFGSVRKKEQGEALEKIWGELFTPLLMDITDEKAIKDSVSMVSEALNGKTLSGLVNNAGIAVAGPLELLKTEELRKQIEVNLIGPFMVAKLFLPLLGGIKDFNGKPGRIINITSVGGRIAMPFNGPYSISKYGLEAFTDSLRRELQIYGIDVIAIGPGAVNTPIWDKVGSNERIKGTLYESPAKKLSDFMIPEGKKGYPPEIIAVVVLKALTLKHPKARYAVVKGKFQNWILPQLMPKRAMDRMLRKS